jgi:multicomponent Na+:H+ antiporter subunit A
VGVDAINLFSVALCFLGAIAAPILYPWLKEKTAYVLSLIPLVIFLGYCQYLPMNPQDRYLEIYPWFPEMGFNLSFLLDGLSLTFALLISGIGFFVLVYAGGYFAGEKNVGRLFCSLMVFMGAMLGLVLSENLFGLFIFWELTSITSFLLIGFKNQKEEARKSAQMALMVTGIGALFLLGGFVLLFEMGRSFGLESSQAGEISWIFRFAVTEHPWYAACFALIFIGAITKSAQFPFHFWLPGAMTAPTPISSYLHSATMVKAGVYLLARFHRGFGETELWFWSLVLVGGMTFVLGAVLATGFKDLKKILAYTTVSVLGALVFLLGIGSEGAIQATMILLIAHALYKAPLFQIAGAIEFETGTRDITKLGGLWEKMPLLGVATLMACLSQAGFPLAFGFFGKELMYGSLVGLDSGLWLGLSVIANAFLGAIAFYIFLQLFASNSPGGGVSEGKEPSKTLLLGPLCLGVTGILFSIFPSQISGGLVSASVSSVLGYVNLLALHYWHGFEWKPILVLGLSAVTLGLAWLLHRTRQHWVPSIEGFMAGRENRSPSQIYARGFEQIFPVAERITGLVQHGYLNRYMTLVIFMFTLGIFAVLSQTGLPSFRPMDFQWTIFSMGLMALPVLGGVFVLTSKSHLAAVACLGITGVGVALLYAIFSAPDLSITQIMVEILTVLLLLFVLYHLPKAGKRSQRRVRIFQFFIATGAAFGVVMLLTLSLEVPSMREFSQFYIEKSVPEAFGRNIVNVILVDFRALDTLGEVIVIAVAGIGVYALLRNSRRGRRKGRSA